MMLVFSGALPARAGQVGLQTFSDPLDSAGIADISSLGVSGFDEDPTSVYVFLYLDEIVAEDSFAGFDTWASIYFDADSDGTEDYFISSGSDLLTSEGESMTIYTSDIQDTGCEGFFFGYPEDNNSWVGFSIDNDCLKLPESFGVSAYANSGNDYDFAPDDGFYQVTNPSGAEQLLANTPVPMIQGSNTIGSKLTAIPGAWDEGVTLNYKWFRQGVQVGTGSTYNVTAADLEQSITVAVTGSKAGFVSATKTSASVVIQLPRLAKSTAPTITGSNRAGSKLTALTGSWDSGVAFSFQWLRNGGLISNQTSSTYTTITDDIGKKISVRVVGTKVGYQSATFTSTQVTIQEAALSKTPTPTLNGSGNPGQTLTAVTGEWDSGVAFSFQWLRDGALMANQTSSSYKVAVEDIGKNISVRVVGSKSGFESATKTSASIVIQLPRLAKSTAPTITGSNRAGSKITALTGSWDSGVAFSFQWLREGVIISNQTSSTYTTITADIGKKISVRVVGTKVGYQSATFTSAQVVVQPATLTKTSTPTLGGTAKPGQTLTAVTGEWDSGVAFSFQWLRDGGLITNQTASSYAPTVDDIGKKISVRVVGVKNGYESVSLTSTQAVVEAGSLSKTPVPTISGTATSGKTLTAVSGEWDAGVALSIQWLREGVAIKDATKASYILTSADKGKKISVRVTGSKTGYVTVVKTSATKTISN
jgi:hypothetical protein